MNRKRWIVIVAAAISVVALIIWGFMPGPVETSVVKVSKGPMQVLIEEEAKTRVKDKFVISAPVSGYMRRIAFTEGDEIKKGMTAAELESPRSDEQDPRSRLSSSAALSEAGEALSAAQKRASAAAAASQYASSNFARMKNLYASGFISKDAMELSETEMKKAEAERLSAEAEERAARFRLERARASAGGYASDSSRVVAVRSPSAGRILKIYRKSEGNVPAGEPLLDVGDPSSLEVRSDVLSSAAVNIRPGMRVVFERWGGQGKIEGKVRIVEPSGFTKVSSLGVEEQRVSVIADLILPEGASFTLGDGFRLDAGFVVWEAQSVLRIPSSALFRKGDGWAAFAVRNGKATIRELKVGSRNGLQSEILSGMTEGEEVVSHPDDRIKEGTAIRPLPR